MSADRGWGYRPALDGLRCVAVYLVVVFHAGVSWFSGGFVGVDLFFVLSGYLVTSILLVELDRTDRIDLPRFYARRVRRLLPAAVVVVVGIAVTWLLVAPLTERLDLVRDARAALLYVSNWNFIDKGQDYFAQSAAAESPYVHFWSLAIEEQFYIVFPLMLLLLHRLTRSRTRVAIGIGVACAVSLLLQVLAGRSNEIVAYYGTHTRLYQMLAGCLLAVLAPKVLAARVPPVADVAMAPVGVLGLVIVGSGAVDVAPSNRGIVATVLSIVVIAGLERRREDPTARLLSLPPVVHLGQISYGTYLWHWPLILVAERLLDVGPWTLAAIAVVSSTAMASLSAQMLETPIRTAKRLDGVPTRVVAGGLTVSVLVALAIPVVLERDRSPALAKGGPSSGEQLVEALGPVPDDIDWKAVENDTFGSPPCPADDVEKCIKVTGTGPTVVLIGDSTARTLIPMFMTLAEEQDFTFAAQVAQGCGWFVGVDRGSENDESCNAARDDWYEAGIVGLDADVVVLAQRDYPDTLWSSQFRTGDPAIDDLPIAEQQSTLALRTLDLVTDVAPHVVVIEPVAAQVTDNPIDCLSGADDISECAFEVEPDLPIEDVLRARGAADPDVTVVDLDEVVCREFPVCVPYAEDLVVWRDEVHVTTWWWRENRQEVLEILRPGLPLLGQ